MLWIAMKNTVLKEKSQKGVATNKVRRKVKLNRGDLRIMSC